MIKFKEIATLLGSISAILIIIGGVSLATLVENTKEVWRSPKKVEKLILKDSTQTREIRKLRNAQEMNWEWARLMTDNKDSTDIWKYANIQGAIFEVDIRETAEHKELAFVYKEHIIYPLYYGPNGRRYIMLHDDPDQNTYLYK